MRIEAVPDQAIRHAIVGLTRDEALTLLANLASWERNAPLEGEWRLDLNDGEHQMTLTVTNHPNDPRFASRFAGAS
jgi:hypothetical protein